MRSTRRSWLTPINAVLLATAVCVASTVVLAAVPATPYAFRMPYAKVMLQTAVVVIAAVAGFLVVGRVRETRRLRSLLLAAALCMTTLGGAFGLLALTDSAPAGARWAALFAALAAAVLFAVAAWAPQRAQIPDHAAVLTAAGLLALTAAIGLAAWLLAARLPRRLGPSHELVGVNLDAPLATAIQGAAMVAFFAAAVGFLTRARGDGFIGWLAVGCVLAGFSRLEYLLFAPGPISRLHVGDIGRLCAMLTMFVAVAVEIAGYWRRIARAAALEERRRIARDLHDNLAQELAYIERNALLLAASDTSERIYRSAERALVEARRAIQALSSGGDEAFEHVLGAEAELAASRYGTTVDLALDRGIELEPARREALVRIASEAVSNAARHNHSPNVHVELRRLGRDGLRLRVVDDGHGFDPASSSTGYGLVSMRERTHAIGGQFRVRSQPGHGTEVEVTL